MTFLTFAADNEDLKRTLILAESLRTFGGRHAEAPLWVFLPGEVAEAGVDTTERLQKYDVVIKKSSVLPELKAFPYAGKVSAAAQGEDLISDRDSLLVLMDADTVILGEPAELMLPTSVAFGYRPVMHRNIGSPWGEPMNLFWRRVYELLMIPESALFPMTTTAAGEMIRPYFNAGLLAVRPEYHIFLWWARSFMVLAEDPQLSQMCRVDDLLNIFFHQIALVGPPLTLLKRDKMLELPSSYNYPLFFDRSYTAVKPFDSLDGVVTLRYGHAFEGEPPDWGDRIKGDPEKVKWLRERIGA